MNIMTSIAEGELLADLGLQQALTTTRSINPGWDIRCWKVFEDWIRQFPSGYQFMTEDFREYFQQQYPNDSPNSGRSYGFIPKRALSMGLIKFSTTAKVKNKKAHATPANVWAVI